MARRLVQLALSALGENVSFALENQSYVARTNGLAFALRWNALLADAWIRDRFARRAYVGLDEEQLRARRRSDTVFVFGSGYSLNDLRDDEWAHFREHDVFGFNEFFRQRWLPVDFHLLRVGVMESLNWRPYAEHVARGIAESPYYRDTVFIVQEGYLAQFGNQLVGYRLLPRGAGVARYKTRRGYGLPPRRLRDGLRHAVGTLDDSVNAAYVLGWKNIVLVGVDLYDSRYFWLPPDKTATSDPVTGVPIAAERNTFRGTRYDERHSTARNGVVQLMAEWSEHLRQDGVQLSVYNPRSLLAAVLPLYATPLEHGIAAPAVGSG